MARHPDCTWIPSPNFGYGRGTHGQLAANIRSVNGGGEFWHSQQGRQAVAIAMFQNPLLQVSAHFLFPKVGKPVQMVDSNDAAWHAAGHIKNDPLPGGPGVGSVANLFFHGFEFEGGPPGNLSEPLTANQVAWGVRVTLWLREAHKSRRIYVLKETEWQHNWVTATACPSGRIPWARILGMLKLPAEEDDMAKLIEAPDGKLYLTDGVFRNHIPAGAGRINDAKKVFGEPVKVGQAFVNDLRTSNPILSAADIAKIVRREMDRETKAV